MKALTLTKGEPLKKSFVFLILSFVILPKLSFAQAEHDDLVVSFFEDYADPSGLEDGFCKIVAKQGPLWKGNEILYMLNCVYDNSFDERFCSFAAKLKIEQSEVTELDSICEW